MSREKIEGKKSQSMSRMEQNCKKRAENEEENEKNILNQY